MNVPVILASASPRRADILRKHGIPFCQIPSGAEEPGSFFTENSAMANAAAKAADLSGKYPDQIILAADTVIEFEHKVIGKPADPEDAFRILKSLSGKCHSVTTGVAVQWKAYDVNILFADISDVFFKETEDSVILEYMKLVNVMDKAGAYALQEHPEMLIRSFSGDPENVIGLPFRAIETLQYLLALRQKIHKG